jgi:DnaJ-domain-containing protein 1
MQEKSLDQTFLMEMMDVREQLEGAQASKDEAALAALEAELTARNAAQIEQIAKLFERFEQLPEGHSERQGLLVQVRRVLNAVKTVRSLLRDLRLD